MDLGKIMKKRVLSLSVYQLAILIALIAMLFFFSDSSLLKRLKYENEICDLKTQIEYYRKQTETDRAKLNELQIQFGESRKICPGELFYEEGERGDLCD